MRLLHFGNNRGFSIISALMTAAMVAAGTSAIISLQLSQQKTRARLNFKYNTMMIRQSIMGSIASEASWAVTKLRNPNMNCLSPNQNFCKVGDSNRTNISLYDASGTLLVDGSNSKKGFRFDGEACDNFSAAGNDNCPLRVSVGWRAACATTPCPGAEEFISVTFEYAPSSKDNNFPLNLGHYNVAEQSRSRLGGQDAPSIICSRLGKIFVGEGKSFNGASADTQGCLPYSAFIGPQGPQGPAGSTGPSGPQGLPGAPGADATCIVSLPIKGAAPTVARSSANTTL